MTKIWDAKEIYDLLTTNKKAVERAIVVLYKLQTDSEKVDKTTKDSNGVGFTAYDADILSNFAKLLLSNGRLSEKQFEVARKRSVKYVRQLVKVANREIVVE